MFASPNCEYVPYGKNHRTNCNKYSEDKTCDDCQATMRVVAENNQYTSDPLVVIVGERLYQCDQCKRIDCE